LSLEILKMVMAKSERRAVIVQPIGISTQLL